MELLYRYGVLTTIQIGRLCFPGVARTTVLRRLRILEEGKLILRISGLEEGLLGWSLISDGVKQIGIDDAPEYRNKNTLRHTVTLAEVRMSLEKIGLGKNWISEVELKRRMNSRLHAWKDTVIPDGMFAANVLGETKMVALELELNPKSRARYNELFEDYSFKNKIGLIWYIVENDTLGENLLRIWESARQPKSPNFMVSRLQSILSDFPKAAMKGLEESRTAQAVFQFSVDKSAQRDALGVSGKSEITVSNLSDLHIQSKQHLSTKDLHPNGWPSVADPSQPTSNDV